MHVFTVGLVRIRVRLLNSEHFKRFCSFRSILESDTVCVTQTRMNTTWPPCSPSSRRTCDIPTAAAPHTHKREGAVLGQPALPLVKKTKTFFDLQDIKFLTHGRLLIHLAHLKHVFLYTWKQCWGAGAATFGVEPEPIFWVGRSREPPYKGGSGCNF